MAKSGQPTSRADAGGQRAPKTDKEKQPAKTGAAAKSAPAESPKDEKKKKNG